MVAVSRPALPSIDELRARAQPAAVLGRPNAEHWMGRWLRRYSIYATRAALRLGISANATTGLMIVVGLAAAAAFSTPGLWALLGVVGIQLYLLLDCTDGEIARWNGSESAVGVYLDRLGHYLVESAIPIAVGLRLSGWEADEWLVLGMATAIAILLSKSETDLVDMARHQSGMPKMQDTARTMRPKGLAAGRRLAALLPFHRIVHAVEASLILAVAIIADRVGNTDAFTQGVLIALAVAAIVTALLHLVSVLSSTRLTAQ
jgi:phosphatidylglycerophosphate synthase